MGAEPDPLRQAGGRRGRLPDAPASRPCATPASAIPSRWPDRPTGGPARLSAGHADGVLRHLSPPTARTIPDLKDALEKLQLNDASLTFEPETSARWASASAAASWACSTWRSSPSVWSASLTWTFITTAPSVLYRLTMTDGTVEMIDNPSATDPARIVKQEEPFVDAHIYTPQRLRRHADGPVPEKRGVF